VYSVVKIVKRVVDKILHYIKRPADQNSPSNRTKPVPSWTCLQAVSKPGM